MGLTERTALQMAVEHESAPPDLGKDDGVAPGNDTNFGGDLDLLMLLALSGNQGTEPQDEYIARLTYYLMGIGGSIVCCLGTIANALSIAVLTRRTMRSSTYIYLAALAICDSLVLFFTLLLILKDTRPPDSPEHQDQFHAVLFPFVHPTAFAFQMISIWLTLAFTVDRYIMICHPFKAERMCRRSRARKVVIGLYISGILINIPRYLEYYTKTDTLKLTNSSTITLYVIEPTAMGQSELFRELMHSWIYLICVCGIPFLTLVVLNAFLIRAVHLSRLKGKEINAREKHRNDTTIMLIGVIVIFLICQGPALVSRMIYAFRPSSVQSKAVFTLNEVGNFLVILNSAINIVPYYLFGRKFRSEFWRLFCTCFFDKDELRRIVRSYSVSMDHRRMSQYNVMEMNGVVQPHRHTNHTYITTNNNDGSAEGGGDSSSATRLPLTHVFSYQSNHQSSNNGAATIRISDTMESVAIPLIHSTCNSLSSTGLVNRDSSKESMRDAVSQFRLPSPSQPLSPHAQGSRPTPNGHVQYMTVTAGPSIQEPEWSTV